MAVTSLCEAAAYYKNKGLTLWDQMIKIYEKYGYYKEEAVSITLEGIDGAEKIKTILNESTNLTFLINSKMKIILYAITKTSNMISEK